MPTPDRDLIPPMPHHVASEFLLWLAYREAMGDEVYAVNDEPCTVLLEEEVELKLPDEEKPSVRLLGVGRAEHPELLASLKAGRVLHRARLFVRAGDREYRLVLTGPQLQWSGVKLPRVVKTGDLGETLYEELFLYEDLHRLVRSVFAQYAARRVDADRWSQESNSMRAWLGETFARVFHFDPLTGQGRLFGEGE
jgi:hypothetical protein